MTRIIGIRVFRRYANTLLADRLALRFAKEFPTPEALQEYLAARPKAKKNLHWVKGDKPAGEANAEKAPRKRKKTPDEASGGAQAKPEETLKEKSAPPSEEATKKRKDKLDAPEGKGESTPKEEHALKGKLEVKHRERIGDGAMCAQLVTVKDAQGKEHKGVWKVARSEIDWEDRRGEELREAIPAGTYYQREVLTSEFDSIFGGKRVVPHTYVHEFENDRPPPPKDVGSLQEFVKNTISTSDLKENVEADSLNKLGQSFESQKMFYMDLITGNDDRHTGNARWVEDDTYGYVPAAIDNGLTWPEGEPCRFCVAVDDWRYIEGLVQHTEETEKCLKDLDIDKMARLLNEMKALGNTAKRGALARAQALKNNPGIMKKLVAGAKDSGDDLSEVFFRWVCSDGTMRVEDGEITEEQYDHIKKLIG